MRHKKFWVDFHEIWKIGGLWIREESVDYRGRVGVKVTVRVTAPAA